MSRRPRPSCRVVTVDVDGEPTPMRVHGVGEPTPDDLAALAEFTRFLRRRAAAEVVELPPAPDVGRLGLGPIEPEPEEGRWT